MKIGSTPALGKTVNETGETTRRERRRIMQIMAGRTLLGYTLLAALVIMAGSSNLAGP